MSTNKNLTSYLKGLAILAVVINHFARRFLPYDIFFGMASYFISLFFILSGYGVYFSLNNLENQQVTWRKLLMKFYYKRFMKIYPIYWCIFFILLFTGIGKHIKYSEDIIYNVLLINFTDPPDAWFLHSLIQCYILAPIIYAILNRSKHFFPFLLIIFFLLSNVLFHFLDVPKVRVWYYGGLYLNNLFLFSVGMYFPVVRSKVGYKAGNPLLSFLFILMIFSFIQNSQFAFFPLNPHLLSAVLFVSCTIIFTFCFIYSETKPVFFNFFNALGLYTLSMYLLDGRWGTILIKTGILNGRNYINGLWFILCFPAFFFVCVLIEEMFSNRFNLPVSFNRTKTNVLGLVSHNKI